MIKAFDDVLRTGLAARIPQRLLLLFVKAVQADTGGPYHIAGAQLKPVLTLDKVLSGRLDFAALVSEADAIDNGWDFVLLGSLSGRDGMLPSSAEAQQHLYQRAQAALEVGDLSRFLVFDRNEQRLWLEPERRLH